ncbi:MAG: hypothetical protein IT585_06620 [candidate division Zixibacteria bacterium]|nr:hypothetical protein [candidate division Zixibacteria bacterium]
MKTLFSYLQSDSSKPSPALALLLFAAVGLLATVVFVFLLRRIRRERGNLELAFWGTATSFILAWLPWLFASSVVNTVFLFLFGMVSIVGFGLRRRLSSRWTRERGARPDFWKMFVNAIKACAAVIAVLLGAIATSVLLPWRNTEVEEFELLRYAFLCAYVITGMIVFVLLPLLARSLENDPSEEVELEVPGPL